MLATAGYERSEPGGPMKRYRIWLHDGRDVTVDGESLEVVDRPRGTAAHGDVLIKSRGHTVAHFWAEDVAGYCEEEVLYETQRASATD
jgi:hypothetical protein